jgi:hypothetical protein
VPNEHFSWHKINVSSCGNELDGGVTKRDAKQRKGEARGKVICTTFSDISDALTISLVDHTPPEVDCCLHITSLVDHTPPEVDCCLHITSLVDHTPPAVDCCLCLVDHTPPAVDCCLCLVDHTPSAVDCCLST